LKISLVKAPTKKYWDSRYSLAHSLGSGSQGRNLQYKVKIIEEIVSSYKICTIVDIGCGEAPYLDKLKFDSYLGVDASDVVIQMNRERYQGSTSIKFVCLEEFNSNPRPSSDLVISSEVIFCLKKEEISEHIGLIDSIQSPYILIFNKLRQTRIHLPFSPNWTWKRPSHWKLLSRQLSPKSFPSALDHEVFANFLADSYF
jgi:hypothetical protein